MRTKRVIWLNVSLLNLNHSDKAAVMFGLMPHLAAMNYLETAPNTTEY